MNFKNINLGQEGTVYTITLNSPENHNALSLNMLKELAEAIESLKEIEANCRVLILRGSGQKAFCSGADLKSIPLGPEFSPGMALDMYFHPVITGLRSCPFPVIAALNGVTAGAGASLALACDYLLAKDTASISQLFIAIGLIPDCGAHHFVLKTLGYHKTFELFTTGQSISANHAQELGLVNEVVSNEIFEEKILEKANFYATMPTQSIAFIKKVLNESGHKSMNETMALEAEYQNIAYISADAKEGISAFIEKRKAKFIGK
jgi:2-(1,2-epoxy-1,2-dihydrophenyl)acetyl-CoA isomerase